MFIKSSFNSCKFCNIAVVLVFSLSFLFKAWDMYSSRFMIYKGEADAIFFFVDKGVLGVVGMLAELFCVIVILSGKLYKYFGATVYAYTLSLGIYRFSFRYLLPDTDKGCSCFGGALDKIKGGDLAIDIVILFLSILALTALKSLYSSSPKYCKL
jgi:hypothetical protein